MNEETKPDCNNCAHKKHIPGNTHIECSNYIAKVTGDKTAMVKDYFFWPLNFDPVWLKSCDGFENKEAKQN